MVANVSPGEGSDDTESSAKIRTLLRKQFDRHQVLCRRITNYLSAVDPGRTPTLGQFLLEANKSFMALNKMDLDDGLISRAKFLKSLKSGVKVEATARQMLRT